MSTETLVKISLRKNDLVQVISGREKSKTGKVLRVFPKSGTVLVEKINMVKRHVKPSQQNPQGGIVEKELPLRSAKLLLFCPKCNKGVRHGVKVAGTGEKLKKSRVCKKCDGSLDS